MPWMAFILVGLKCPVLVGENSILVGEDQLTLWWDKNQIGGCSISEGEHFILVSENLPDLPFFDASRFSKMCKSPEASQASQASTEDGGAAGGAGEPGPSRSAEFLWH